MKERGEENETLARARESEMIESDSYEERLKEKSSGCKNRSIYTVQV